MPIAEGEGGRLGRRGARTWYIRHVDLFRRLNAREADDLARAMPVRYFAAGELIVGPGAEPEWVYVTRSGTVRLFQPQPGGRQETVDRLEAGHLFGVTALLGPAASPLLAEAETDVEVCAADGQRFLHILSQWPNAAVELAVRLGFRVPAVDTHLARLSAIGARARLAHVLYELAREATETQPGGGVRLRGVPRHAELAQQIGASRETVTRMLARLEEDGYIRRFGRQIVIPDVARVAEDFDLESRG
jgi:CRP-like cAMP-binding protein